VSNPQKKKIRIRPTATAQPPILTFRPLILGTFDLEPELPKRSRNLGPHMKKLLFLLLFGLVTCTLNAQQAPHDGCASDQMLQRLLANDPRAALRQAAFDQQLADIAMIRGNQRTSGITTVRTIPVVVHIIHNGGPENLSNTVIQQGIQDMNDAFANVGIYDPLTGVNTDIQFCLASQDPSGAGTTGIVRVQSPLTNVIMETQDLSLKALSRWDPTKYLNIWLVAEISSQSMGSGVAGYAYFPSSHGQPEDGIVNEARWFGSNPHNSKIHVHEAGHYLGLYHTFQGGCTNNNCLTDGDHVCDTPPDNSTAATICTNAMNTCATDDDDLSNNNPFQARGEWRLGRSTRHDHELHGLWLPILPKCIYPRPIGPDECSIERHAGKFAQQPRLPFAMSQSHHLHIYAECHQRHCWNLGHIHQQYHRRHDL
jgi:hypothetical protein